MLMCVNVRVCACNCVCMHVCVCAWLTKMQWRPAHPGLLRCSTPLPLPTAATASAPALRLPGSLRPHFPRKRTSSEFAFYFRACNAIGRTKRLRRTDCAGRRDKGERGKEGKEGLPGTADYTYLYICACTCGCVCVCVRAHICAKFWMFYFIFYAFLFCFLSAYFAFYEFLTFFFGVLCMYMRVCVRVYILIERAHAHTHT